MSLAAMLFVGNTRRRRGRPRISDDRAKRIERIRWAALVLSRAVLVKQAAAANGVSRRTILRWIKDALGYDDPEAEGLRRIERMGR